MKDLTDQILKGCYDPQGINLSHIDPDELSTVSRIYQARCLKKDAKDGSTCKLDSFLSRWYISVFGSSIMLVRLEQRNLYQLHRIIGSRQKSGIPSKLSNNTLEIRAILCPLPFLPIINISFFRFSLRFQ